MEDFFSLFFIVSSSPLMTETTCNARHHRRARQDCARKREKWGMKMKRATIESHKWAQSGRNWFFFFFGIFCSCETCVSGDASWVMGGRVCVCPRQATAERTQCSWLVQTVFCFFVTCWIGYPLSCWGSISTLLIHIFQFSLDVEVKRQMSHKQRADLNFWLFISFMENMRDWQFKQKTKFEVNFHTHFWRNSYSIYPTNNEKNVKSTATQVVATTTVIWDMVCVDSSISGAQRKKVINEASAHVMQGDQIMSLRLKNALLWH